MSLPHSYSPSALLYRPLVTFVVTLIVTVVLFQLASKPAFSSASTTVSRDTLLSSCSTVIVFDGTSTSTLPTPSKRPSAFLILLAHPSHVIPSAVNFVCILLIRSSNTSFETRPCCPTFLSNPAGGGPRIVNVQPIKTRTPLPLESRRWQPADR